MNQEPNNIPSNNAAHDGNPGNSGPETNKAHPKDNCEVRMTYGRDALLDMLDKAYLDLSALQVRDSPGKAGSEANPAQPEPPRIPHITFRTPGEFIRMERHPENELVGDSHVMRGEIAVIGGEPGVGKSRAATALAVAGATGGTWFGLAVHRKFKTMVVQTENGCHRIQQELSALDYPALEDWVRISEPPPFGISLNHPEFIADIKAALDEFKPDVVVLDPWNAAARDDKQKDYAETFHALRALLPIGPDKPALVIVAHTRKPIPGEKRKGGTDLQHIISGSHILTSTTRSLFVMTRASDDETSDLVVWFNPKNNNGQMVSRTAWHRTNAGYVAAEGFDWEGFDNSGGERNVVTLEDLRELFENGEKQLTIAEAKEALAEIAGISVGGAYNALNVEGKFAKHLSREGKLLTFHP